MRVGKPGRFLAAVVMLAVPFAYGASSAVGDKPPKTMDEKVRHEINMLPYYGVFDDLSYRVDGDKVTLFGQVWQPTLKRDTENAVKHIEGVRHVDNQIEVLPLSNFDDQIRYRTLRAIYAYPSLSRYALGTHPSIHILVKNGNVTLTGVVANTMDRDLAYLRANGVSGAFSVKNDLRIED